MKSLLHVSAIVYSHLQGAPLYTKIHKALIYWCSLKMAIKNSRNIYEWLPIHGQVQFVGNKLIYICISVAWKVHNMKFTGVFRIE
jgi:hypothetical protein